MASGSLSSSTRTSRLAEQLKVSGGGICAALVGVPYMMSNWTPTSIALLWMAVYFVQACFFLGVTTITGSDIGRSAWAISTALMIALVNVSVLIWGQETPSAPWIAMMVSFAYLAFQVATLPYLEMNYWQVGFAVVGASMVMVGIEAERPFLAFAFVPLVFGITVITGRNRSVRKNLDSRLVEVSAMLSIDPLTALLNRRGLEKIIGDLQGQEITVALFDADKFKLINDTQGHGVGDQALKLIAERLRTTLPSTWTIARLGGDEFVAVSEGHSRVGDEVIAPFQMVLVDRPGEVRFSMSSGSATGTASGIGDRLLSEAGHALRQAKREGRRTLHSEGPLRERFERSKAITRADANERIVPVVQVIVDGDGVAGCEALARWKNDEGVLLAPDQFMDMLVENGLRTLLDNVMLDHAARLAAQFEHDGVDIFVSANIAASHLLDPGLVDTVSEILRRHDVSPRRLMIEITESESIGSRFRWETAVRGLRELGVLLAIDDFGAGYSSVARLKNLPITHLKLDRSLVTGATGPLGEIVEGVVGFCHASNICVIGEGIETLEDQISMRSAEVDLFQGFLFGRPMRVRDFIDDVADRSKSKEVAESINQSMSEHPERLK